MLNRYSTISIFLPYRTTQPQGKMKAYSLVIYIICCIYRYTSIEIKPELKKYILKFGYGITSKYEGMIAHCFYRFYVVTKFILPTVEDLKFSTLNFNGNCEYLREDDKEHNGEARQLILDLVTYCRKIRLHVYKQQIKSFSKTAHHILKNGDLILPQFSTNRKERGIITSLITGILRLAYEGISSFCTIEGIKIYIK